MTFPGGKQRVEIGFLLDGEFVDAIDNGNGVRLDDGVTISNGRSNWASQTDPGRAGFTLDNRDGRWSRRNPNSPYSGLFKKNIRCRVGVGQGTPYLAHNGGSSKDVATTPDIPGAGGGSPTAPTVVGSAEISSETSFTTTHTFDLPATVLAGEWLTLVAGIGHSSAQPSGGTMDDWNLVFDHTLHQFHRFLIYNIYVEDSTQATALAGSQVTFSTLAGNRSSCQVFRVSGARNGGAGSAYDVSAGELYADGSPYSDSPDPDEITVGWGADENLIIGLFTSGREPDGTGADVTANPASYTALDDGDINAVFIVGSAHRAVSVATEDPGAFTLTDTASWAAVTLAYRALEDTSANGILDITGDIDLRFDFQLEADPENIALFPDGSSGTRTRLAHKSSGVDGWEVDLYLLGPQNLGCRFVWRDAGGSFHRYDSFDLPLTALHERTRLRITLDVDNGAGDSTCVFQVGDSMAGPWTTVTTATGEGVTSIRGNDAPIRLAGNPFDPFNPMVGRFYAFELRDGIDGTVVANPDFEAQTVGASGFTDAAGRIWTVGTGGRITDTRWRFHGELASIPTRWDTQGRNITAPVEAAGLFRRLRQGNRRLDSPLRRAITRFARNLVQYWPMEETGDNVTVFGAAVGTAGFAVTGGSPDAATNSQFVASKPIPAPGDSTWTANVDFYEGTDQFQVRWLQVIPDSATGTDLEFIEVDTTDIRWVVQFRDTGTGQHRVVGYRGGSQVYASSYFAFDATGTARRMSFAVSQNGSNVDVRLESLEVGDTSAGGFSDPSAVGGSAGRVTTIRFNKDNDIGDWAIGQVTLQNTETSSAELIDELNAFDGEKAGDRIRRLCREEGIASRVQGDPADTETMGPQRAGSLIDLLEECAQTDLGILFEPRETLAVGYRTRASMIGQTATLPLDYAAGHLLASPEPDEDDQDFANDIEVKNHTGATARAVLDDGSDLSVSEPPVGAGLYDSTFEVNGVDSRLPDMAATRLALSSVDEPRISRLSLGTHLDQVQNTTGLVEAILTARLGDLLTVDNNLDEFNDGGQLRQLAQGTRDNVGQYQHRIDVLTSPASPFDGGVSDPDAGHTVTFRTQLDLAVPGTPAHVLTQLGYTDTAKITRADLDDILDDWVANTGGNTRTATTEAEFNTAVGAAQPGDLVRITSNISATLQARGSRFSIPGSNMSGGAAGLPIILTCADGVYIEPGDTTAFPDVALDIRNVLHVWPVGVNVRDSVFGIRHQNWGGTAGFPAYSAYNRSENMGHNNFQFQGWFQSIAASGGTIPVDSEIASPGVDWGYSEHFVCESNIADGAGVFEPEFGEAYYFGTGTQGGGWHGFCRDFWVRGNEGLDWTSDSYDIKPGCHRAYGHDNTYSMGHAFQGAPVTLCLVVTANSNRPSWFDFDPQIYWEANRGWDSDLTNTDASSDHIMGYIGLSGIRVANNITWAHPQTGTHAAWRVRNQKGTNDTEAEAEFGTDPTWVVNNTHWGDDSVDLAGYGSTPTAFPSSITNIIDLRNNIVDQASPADGEVDADASDFIADVPAIGVVGTAEWSTFGPGSAFDLDPDSALVASGESIADLELLIDADISGRAIPASNPNPGAFQQHPSNL